MMTMPESWREALTAAEKARDEALARVEATYHEALVAAGKGWEEEKRQDKLRWLASGDKETTGSANP
mgnify:CR=1 FL=1